MAAFNWLPIFSPHTPFVIVLWDPYGNSPVVLSSLKPMRPGVSPRALNIGLRRSLSDCQTLPKHYRTSLTNGSHDDDHETDANRETTTLPRIHKPAGPIDTSSSEVTLRIPRPPSSPTNHLSYYPSRSNTFSGVSRPLSLQVVYYRSIVSLSA